MFCFHDTDGPVGVAVTDRRGGVSPAPYASLNLGTGTGDDPANVGRNLDLVAAALGVAPEAIVRMRQVHGADVAVVRGPPEKSPEQQSPGQSLGQAPGQPPEADALVTDRPGLTLAVRVADCLPVLLADPAAGVVGCAHAGRGGVAAGVVARTVEAMRVLGARDVSAWVGPGVCGACYEVPASMQQEVAAVVPQARSTTSWGTPALDLAAGVAAQLEESGCTLRALPARCTREDADLYSHRRDGPRTGRFAGLVWLRS